MTDQSHKFPRFFVTAASPCPYLEGQEERKVFTDLNMADAQELNDALGRVGFRRSQAVAYRPACENCNACVSVRVLAQEFSPTRSMRKTYNHFHRLKSEATDAFATAEQFALLKKYLGTRHAGGGMSDMDEFEFAEMVELSPVDTCIIEYREPPQDDDYLRPGRLVGAALTDVMSDGLSMVYSFFDPDYGRKGLGTYMILDHIRKCKNAGLPHVYLGYWVEGCDKMDYKVRFKPIEKLSTSGWVREYK